MSIVEREDGLCVCEKYKLCGQKNTGEVSDWVERELERPCGCGVLCESY